MAKTNFKEGLLTLGAGFVGKGFTLIDPHIDLMTGTSGQPVLKRASTWLDIIAGGALLGIGMSGKIGGKEVQNFMSATGAFLLATKVIDLGVEMTGGAAGVRAAPVRAAPVNAGAVPVSVSRTVPDWSNGRIITID